MLATRSAILSKRLICRRDNTDNNIATVIIFLSPSWSPSSLIGGGRGSDSDDERTAADGRPTFPLLPKRVPDVGRRYDAHNIFGIGLQHSTVERSYR